MKTRDEYRSDAVAEDSPLRGFAAPLEVKGLIMEILDRYRVTWEQITGRTRPNWIAHPRQLIAAIMAWHSQFTMVRIGEILGGRDHGTIIHARTRIGGLMDTEPEVADLVTELVGRHFGDMKRRGGVRGSRCGFTLPPRQS